MAKPSINDRTSPPRPLPRQPRATHHPATPPPVPARHHENSGTWGWISLIVLALAGGAGWWWYQHRDASETTGAAKATSVSSEGELLLDARPWGRIEKVLDTASGNAVTIPAGSPFTPRVVVLPTGSYEVTVSHLSGASSSCRVDIVNGQRQTCEVRFFEADPRAYFKEYGW